MGAAQCLRFSRLMVLSSVGAFLKLFRYDAAICIIMDKISEKKKLYIYTYISILISITMDKISENISNFLSFFIPSMHHAKWKMGNSFKYIRKHFHYWVLGFRKC